VFLSLQATYILVTCSR